jgi:AraC-like DNA-binding protein/mannose-6-phosphate isomerase-like protein (cupin superfamily)
MGNTAMAHRTPLSIEPPAGGVLAAESAHDRHFSMAFQQHAFHEVFALVRGRMEVLLESPGNPEPERLTLRPGSFLAVAAAVRHQLLDSAGSTLLLFSVHCDLTEREPDRRTLWDALAAPPIRAITPTPPETRLLHDRIRSQMALQRPASTPEGRLAGTAHFDEMLLTLYRNREQAAPPESEERVRAFYRRLPGQIHERWDVDRAAGATALSRRRFTELFRQVVGEPFSPALQRLRLERVCELLASGEQSIAGAAFSCGFEDLSHFYRLFRRRYHVPPGEWLSGQGRRNR